MVIRVLLISAKTTVSKGGVAIWTEHYIKGCEYTEIEYDIVNSAMIGERAVRGTARRNLRDEFVRTRSMFRQLKCFLRANTYDVAHLNTNVGPLGIIRDYYLAKKIVKNNIPLVVHFHCDVPHWVKNKLIRSYTAKLLSLSDINFVLCENSQRFLQEAFRAESVKVPNFVEEAMLTREKVIRSHIQSVIFVGRVSEAKGAKELFEVAKRFPEIQFQFIGEVSAETAQLERPENVDLPGILPHDSILRCMDHSDVFLFPSHTEGFSLALAEAMARGLPVIATPVGANEDMLEHRGGMIVPVGDISAMQAALSQIDDMRIRDGMSKWNIQKVRNNYITPMVIALLKKYYLSVMGSN